MAATVAGFATSHATTLMPPSEWEGIRSLLRGLYEERLGVQPPPGPDGYLNEAPADATTRYAQVADLHDQIAQRLTDLAPDLLIVIGNDQDEDFGAFATPQFAVYTGDEVESKDRASGTSERYRCDRAFALELVAQLLGNGFDVAQAWDLHSGALTAHAFTQIAHRFVPNAETPILPIFVNAVTPPFPPPRRYFEFGRALREALAAIGKDKRIVLAASGGLSHFTLAQFTLAGYEGPHVMGSICAEFDHFLVDAMREGDFERLAALSADELVANGDGEFLQTLTMLGALPDAARPDALVYEPIYRAMVGTFAAFWDLSG